MGDEGASSGNGRAPLVLTIGGGVVGGLVAGLFGVGGGIVLVPILVLLLHVPQHGAHATSLVAVTLGAAAALARFAVDGTVEVAGAVALASGAVVGARLGSDLLPRISERGLRRVFALVIISLSLRFLIVGAAGEGAEASVGVPDLDLALVVLHAIGGLAAGITSSVLGVGGGIILVPLLVVGFGYGQQIAEGTSLAVIVPTALVGAIAHSRRGYTRWSLGATLGVGAVAGGLVGAHIALSLDPSTLGRLYGGLQLIVGVLLLTRGEGTGDPEA